MLENLFLLSVFILLISPFFLIGFLVETMQKRKRARLRDEYARQSYQQTLKNQQK